MERFFKFSVLLLFLLFSPSLASSVEMLNVAINEIAWAGTTEGWQYEWIELFNLANHTIDLTNWQVENAQASNKTLVIAAGIIADEGPATNALHIEAGKYFLICRSGMGLPADETMAAGESCDLIEVKLSLHNEYDKNGPLVLRDREGNLIDATPEPAGKAWPGGSNETKQTMERINPFSSGSHSDNWQTSQEPNGTPKQHNSATGQAPKAESNQMSPTTTVAATAEIKIEDRPLSAGKEGTYPDNIFINEILPSPEGADNENEWIELYNAHPFEVDLSGWQLKDKLGAVRTYSFPADTDIGPQDFLLCPRTNTGVTLQNSGDELELLSPQGEMVHTIAYPKAPQGQSYNRTSTGWQWSTTLTPEKENIISPAASSDKPLPEKLTAQGQYSEAEGGKTDDSQEKNIAKSSLLASAEKTLSKPSSRLLTFLLACIIAVSSAVIVLILKRKISEEI